MKGKKHSVKKVKLKNKKKKERSKKIRIDNNGELMEEREQKFLEKRQHGSIHHIFPTSRGGPRENHNNKYTWPGVTPKDREAKHRAWHQLFYNFLPSETIKMILDWTLTSGELNKEKIGKNNQEAWKIVFEGLSPYEVVVFIIKRFVPVEIECFNNNCFKKDKISLEKRGQAKKDPVKIEQ